MRRQTRYNRGEHLLLLHPPADSMAPPRPSLHRSTTTPFYPPASSTTPPPTHVSAPSPPALEPRHRAHTTTAAAPRSVGSVWGGGGEGQGPAGERIYPHASVRHFRRGPRGGESQGSASGASQEWWSSNEGTGTPAGFSAFKSAQMGTTATGLSSAWGSEVGEVDTPGSNEEPSWPMAVRFEHEVSADGQNLIVTGRQGELRSCEDEVRSLLSPLTSS